MSKLILWLSTRRRIVNITKLPGSPIEADRFMISTVIKPRFSLEEFAENFVGSWIVWRHHPSGARAELELESWLAEEFAAWKTSKNYANIREVE